MPLGTDVGLSIEDFVLDGDPVPPPKKGGRAPKIFGPCLLWPNGWMDQDATWHEGRPQSRRLCVRWGPSRPPHKGVGAPSPIFGQFLLWPNGWMHQDATWYGDSTQTRGLWVGWGPRPPPKREAEAGGRVPQFSAHLYCGQMAGCIKMPLGTEVGLMVQRCRLKVRQNFFSVRIVHLWNKLPESVVESASVSVFKKRLDDWIASSQVTSYKLNVN